MKILVVDDERAIRFSLAELLESEGHEVREAGTHRRELRLSSP